MAALRLVYGEQLHACCGVVWRMLDHQRKVSGLELGASQSARRRNAHEVLDEMRLLHEGEGGIYVAVNLRCSSQTETCRPDTA